MKHLFYGCARHHRISCAYANVYTLDIDKKSYCSCTGDIRKIINDHWDWLVHSFDAFLFTPPCNYYSRANWRRETSKVALETKDLLPLCLNFAVLCGKPFIVENVQNSTLLKDLFPTYQFTLGGHTFWSNVLKADDFVGVVPPKQNKQNVNREKRDDNWIVDYVLTKFTEKVCYDLAEI